MKNQVNASSYTTSRDTTACATVLGVEYKQIFSWQRGFSKVKDYIFDHHDLKLTAPSCDTSETILVMAGARKPMRAPLLGRSLNKTLIDHSVIYALEQSDARPHPDALSEAADVLLALDTEVIAFAVGRSATDALMLAQKGAVQPPVLIDPVLGINTNWEQFVISEDSAMNATIIASVDAKDLPVGSEFEVFQTPLKHADLCRAIFDNADVMEAIADRPTPGVRHMRAVLRDVRHSSETYVMGLANAAMVARRPERAMAIGDIAVSRFKSSQAVLGMMARLCQRKGDVEATLGWAQKAFHVNEAAPGARSQLAQALADTGAKQEAIDLLHAHPNEHPLIDRTLATLFLSYDDLSSAREVIESALARFPENAALLRLADEVAAKAAKVEQEDEQTHATEAAVQPSPEALEAAAVLNAKFQGTPRNKKGLIARFFGFNG